MVKSKYIICLKLLSLFSINSTQLLVAKAISSCSGRARELPFLVINCVLCHVMLFWRVLPINARRVQYIFILRELSDSLVVIEVPYPDTIVSSYNNRRIGSTTVLFLLICKQLFYWRHSMLTWVDDKYLYNKWIGTPYKRERLVCWGLYQHVVTRNSLSLLKYGL